MKGRRGHLDLSLPRIPKVQDQALRGFGGIVGFLTENPLKGD